MKTSEYPEEDSRTVPFSATEEPSRPAAAEKPRYVDVPVSPEQARAQRNLAWGVVCLMVTLIGVWIGFKLDPSGTLKCLAASLGTFGVLWLLYNFQIFRQRHGQFLGLGLAALLGGLLPLIAAALGSLDRLADERLADRARGDGRDMRFMAPPPVPTAANAPAAPQAPELWPESDGGPAAPAFRQATEMPPMAARNSRDDGQVRDLVSPPPDLAAGKIITIKEDCIVPIDGQKFRLKEGDNFNYTNFEDGIVTFLANGKEIQIGFENVRFIGRSREDKERINKMAWEEAFNRYPALRDEKSPENRLLNATWPKMEAEPDGVEFLKDPRWPVILADQLAKEHQWVTSDGAAAPPDEPANAGIPPAARAPESVEEDVLLPLDSAIPPAPLPRRAP